MAAARFFPSIVFLVLFLFCPRFGGAQGVDSVLTDTVRYTMADTSRARGLLEEASREVGQGNYRGALTAIKKSKEIYIGTVGPRSKEICEVLNSLGVCNIYLGNYHEAKANLQNAIGLFAEIGLDNTLDQATCYNVLGYCFKTLEQLDSALINYEKAFAIRDSLLPSEHPAVVTSLNNIGMLHLARSEYSQATSYLEKVLAIQKNTDSTDSLSIAKTYNNLGTVKLEEGDIHRAIEHFEKSVQIREELLGKFHPTTAISVDNLGVCYYYLGQHNKALTIFTDVEKIYRKFFPPNHPSRAYLYNHLGLVYHTLGDLNRALDCYEKTLMIRLNTFGKNHSLVGTTYHNLGTIYLELGLFSKALENIQKGLEIRKSALGLKHFEIISSYYGLGQCYIGLEEYESAIKILEESRALALEIFGKESFSSIFALSNLCGVHLNNENLEDARNCFMQTVEILKGLYGEGFTDLFRNLNNLAVCYSKESQFEKADSVFDISLAVLNNDEYPNQLGLAKTLHLKGKNFFSWSNKNKPKLLWGAKKHFDLAIQSLQMGLAFYSGDESRSVFLSMQQSLLEEAIQTTLLLLEHDTKLQSAFDYSERSKSLLLYQSIQESNALHFANIPDSLLEKEYDLRVDITYYDKKRQEKLSEGLEETDTTVLAISSRLFDLNQAYDSLKARFETEYPEYYNLKYDLSTVSVQEVQDSLLDDGQALLEYFVGDSSIFIFLVKKDDYQVYEVKRDFPLKDWVEQLRHHISRRHIANMEAYAEVAPKLYDKLLAPVAGQLPERLIIVPDGILGYIPFEALLTEAPQNAYQAEHFPYLLRQKQISYSYSATLLREMQQKKHRQAPTRGMLAMAPFADTDTILTSHLDQSDWLADMRSGTLRPLPWSGAELDSLKNIFHTDAFYGQDATEERFANLAGDYRFIHLPTHGKADSRTGDYSWLAFAPRPDSLENELLYVRDLYNLSLNADLVALSACETAAGELQRGEGIISLARAFAYAGAKSIATTLWQVNDRSTQELMVSFYRYLRAGLPKDEALRRAKLDYLEAHSGTAAHPCFWAAVIGIGDMDALK